MNTILSTQSRSPSLAEKTLTHPEREALEQMVIRGTVGNRSLTRGLLVFTQTHLGSKEQAEILGPASEGIGSRLRWGVKVVRETLQVGASVGGA